MPFSSSNPVSKGVSRASISQDEAGQRVDNYLLRHYKGVPKSHIYRIIRKGEVRVNRKRVKPDYRLCAGDEVRLPPVRVSQRVDRRPPDDIIQHVVKSIVYDDDDLLVVNKPSGLAVHAGSGVDYGVIDALNMHYQPNEVFLVHRLDRETSGCLLIAKNRQVMRSLNETIKQGELDKRYYTLLQGQWKHGTETIDLPLLRDIEVGGERITGVNEEDGKPATSVFVPVELYRDATLMQVKILTGRTHQIRAHAQAVGYPVAGDRRYGDSRFNIKMKGYGLKRLFLHAYSLTFVHPVSGEQLIIDAPLDGALQKVLDQLPS